MSWQLTTRLRRHWEGLRVGVVSRVASVPLALGTGGVLGLAMWLEPDPLGHSTHRQLGLASCTFLTLTGHPCPMCGATTTFSLLAHLRPLEAIVNQPFAALLFALTIGVFGVSCAEIIQPRNRWGRFLERIEPVEGRLALGLLVAMGGGWIYKIFRMSGG